MLETLRSIAATVAALGIAIVVAVGPADAQDLKLTVKGGEAPFETPFVARVKPTIPVGLYALKSDDRSEIPVARVFQEGDHRLLATVLPAVTGRQSTTFALKRLSESGPAPSAGISFRSNGPNVIVDWNQKLLTAYHVDAGHKPFFFPLIGPTGERFTRAYPMESIAGEDRDHPHQRSCWFTYGNVNGIDFWAETKDSGRIRESARELIVQGPVLGRMRTTNEWLAPDGRKVLDDERLVTFYHTENSRIIDFDIKLEATRGPVTFNDTKEGMFGIRTASTMDVTKKAGGKITNAEGLTDDKAWGQASPWVDYVGPSTTKPSASRCSTGPTAFGIPQRGMYALTDYSRRTPSAGTISVSRPMGLTRSRPGNRFHFTTA